MSKLYIYIDENYHQSVFNRPDDDAQEFIEFGGGCRLEIDLGVSFGLDAQPMVLTSEEQRFEISEDGHIKETTLDGEDLPEQIEGDEEIEGI